MQTKTSENIQNSLSGNKNLIEIRNKSSIIHLKQPKKSQNAAKKKLIEERDENHDLVF